MRIQNRGTDYAEPFGKMGFVESTGIVLMNIENYLFMSLTKLDNASDQPGLHFVAVIIISINVKADSQQAKSISE